MTHSKANRRIMIILGIGALLVLAGVAGHLGPVRWAYNHTVAPIGRGMTGFGSGLGEMVSGVGRVKDLARENLSLERENAALRQRLAADAETRRDNDLLRKQLGLEAAASLREIATEVIAFQPDSYRQFVTINKGSKAGIAQGMAVTAEGVLIGTVLDVQPTTARIILVTDPEFKLAAKDQDTGASGIVIGQLGGGLLLEKIGQTDTVKPGDTVTTSGLGGLVPAGLYIGQIQSVNTRSNVVFQSAQVETSLRVRSLRFAYVVAGP